jgi:nucleoside-diphosphate-sugar epimerase
MEPDDLLRDLLGPDGERVVFERGDVTDRDRLREVAGRHGVTSLIHAAAITPRLDRERREPDRIIDVNLGGTVNALDVARELPSVRRFVYISSVAVWGDQPDVPELTEESPSRTTNLYGITKFASERIALRYKTLFGMDVVAVRPGNVYGPMERVTPGYLGATQLREMLRIHFDGRPILVNSLDCPHLDWTYVEDIAEGVERIWEHDGPLPHDVYTLTCGRLWSIGDVLAAFARHLPGLRYRQVPESEANYFVAGGPPGPVPSNARLRNDLGWTPSTPFDDGMRQYLSWIAEHGPQ